MKNPTEAAAFDLKAHLVERGQLSRISFAHRSSSLGSAGGNWQLATGSEQAQGVSSRSRRDERGTVSVGLLGECMW